MKQSIDPRQPDYEPAVPVESTRFYAPQIAAIYLEITEGELAGRIREGLVAATHDGRRYWVSGAEILRLRSSG
jgi:hypothetical protein